MDADSSYGGSDTAHDGTLGQDNNSMDASIPNPSHDCTSTSPHGSPDSRNYYKNEISLPVNCDENDFKKTDETSTLPHYLSTAKLNIDETLENHSNLDELHKKYRSSQRLNDTPKPSKKMNAGVDNPAYHDDENNVSVKPSRDDTMGYRNGNLNGSSKSNRDDEPQAEAVNLELINLKPNGKDVAGPYENGKGISGIPVKKDNFESGTPYDEYFVPVNEHRKYMRGEKLYVTKDKREKSKRNKCLCWSLCLIAVAAVVIVGILAAIGVIGNPEAQPIEEGRSFSGTSSSGNSIKTAGGLFGTNVQNKSTTELPMQPDKTPLTPSPPSSTVSFMPPTTPAPINEDVVPRTLQSQLSIDNLQFRPELEDQNSTDFKELADAVEEELKSVLFNKDVLNYGAANITLKVLEFLPGSVIVKFRVGWVMKDGIHNAKDPIDMTALKRKLQNALAYNHGYIANYRIAEDSIVVETVKDLCKINNNGCEYKCSFNYEIEDFVCECPIGQYVQHDRKSCGLQNPSSMAPELEFDHHTPIPDQIHGDEVINTSTILPATETSPIVHSERIVEVETTTENIHPHPAINESGNAVEHITTLAPHTSSETPTTHVLPDELITESPVYEHTTLEDQNQPQPTNKPITTTETMFTPSDVLPIVTEIPQEQETLTEMENKTQVNLHNEAPIENISSTEINIETTQSQNEDENLLHEMNIVTTAKANELKMDEIDSSKEYETTTQVEMLPENLTQTPFFPQQTHNLMPEVSSENANRSSNTEPTTSVYEVETTKHILPDGIENSSPPQQTTMAIATDSSAEVTEMSLIKQTTITDVIENSTSNEMDTTSDSGRQPKFEDFALGHTPVEPEMEYHTHNHDDDEEREDLIAVHQEMNTTTSSKNALEENIKNATSEEFDGQILNSTLRNMLANEVVANTINPLGRNESEFNAINQSDSMYNTPESTTTMNMNEEYQKTDQENSGNNMDVEVQTTRMVGIQTTLKPDFDQYSEISEFSSTSSINVPNKTESTEEETLMEANKTVIPTSTEFISSGRSFNFENHPNKLDGNYDNKMSPATPRNNYIDDFSEKPTNESDIVGVTSEENDIIETTNNRSELTTSTNPPRLDNDEMNVTNPFDKNVTDVALGVLPLEESKDEVSAENDSEVGNNSTTVNEITTRTNQMEPSITEKIIPAADNVSVDENKNNTELTTTVEPSTFIPFEDVKINSNQNYSTTTNEYLENYRNLEHVITESPTNQSQSNNLSDTISNITQENMSTNEEQNFSSSAVPELTLSNYNESFNTVTTENLNGITNTTGIINNLDSKDTKNMHDINNRTGDSSTSEEDLIAMETTTTYSQNSKNNLDTFSGVNSTNVTQPLIHNFTNSESTKEDEHNDTIIPITRSPVSMDDHPENTTNSDSNVAVEKQNISSHSNDSNNYQVHEVAEDLTTLKPLTIPTKSDKYEPLPVLPLDSNQQQSREEINPEIQLRSNSLDNNNLNGINDISDDKEKYSDKYYYNDKKKEFSKSTESSVTSSQNLNNNSTGEQEEDYLIATDFINRSTFTDQPNFGDNATANHSSIPTQTDYNQLSDANTTPNIKPVVEEHTVGGFSRCSAGQFQCINGTSTKGGYYCVSNNDRCDSINDCTDGSDEIGCAEENCRDNFQCKSGQCLKRHLVCDGIVNCDDNSDEENCETWKCNFDELSCGDGKRCIPLSWKCDGKTHCFDGSDEQNCNSQCESNYFHCVEKDSCIPASWRCDGSQDCKGGEDEKLCECSIDQFKCSSGGGCIQAENRCDGLEQCPDLSDEWNCVRFGNTNESSSPLEVLTLNNSWEPICGDNWNSTYSDLACQSMGYAKAIMTNYVKPKGNSSISKYLKLNPTHRFGASLLAQLEKTDSCDNIVTLSCLENVCGNNNGLDTSSFANKNENENDKAWPSIALLFNRRYQIQCTANIISPTWVLSSYACMHSISGQPPSSNPYDWDLLTGGNNFFDSSADNSSIQSRSVRNIISYPQAKYSQFIYRNNVALIQLSTPLNLEQNISAVCLPHQNQEANQYCITVGWSLKKPGESSLKEYIRYLTDLNQNKDCNSSLYYNGQFSSDLLCVEHLSTEEPCENDQGAPLMCFSELSQNWELRGLLSLDGNCQNVRRPSLFTSISGDIGTWIENTIGAKPKTFSKL